MKKCSIWERRRVYITRINCKTLNYKAVKYADTIPKSRKRRHGQRNASRCLTARRYQARRVADALCTVLPRQTDARSLELCVGMGENEKCIARWTYKGCIDGRTEQTRLNEQAFLFGDLTPSELKSR